MKDSKIIILTIIFVMVLSLSMVASADIWKKHVNSNRCDNIIGNGKEVWVRSQLGGITRWDLSTIEPERFYDATGFSNYVNCMTYDDQDRLLVVDNNKYIYRYEEGVFNYLTETPFGVDDNFAFADGSIIISDYVYNDQWVYMFDGEKWEEVPELSAYKVIHITSDPRGGYWIVTQSPEHAIVYVRDGWLRPFGLSRISGIDGLEESGLNIISNVDVDSEGVVWVTLRGGIAWYEDEEWNQYYWDLVDMPYRDANVARDLDGIVWVAGWLDGLFRYDGSSWTNMEEYEGVKVLMVSAHPANGVWVGTEVCLEHFDGETRTPHMIDNLIPISNELKAISSGPDGELWVGDRSGDIAVLMHDKWTPYLGRVITGTEWENPGSLQTILASSSSGLWAGFEYDLIRYSGNLWTSYRSELVGESGLKCEKLVEGPGGEIWVSLRHGQSNLACWSNERWTFYDKFAKDMDFDPEGNPIILSSDGIEKLDGNSWSIVFPKNQYPEKAIQTTTLSVMKNGYIWVGCTYCVFVLSDGEIVKYFDAETGLPGRGDDSHIGVKAIKQGVDDTIWILLSTGIVNYDGINIKTYTHEEAGFYPGGVDMVIDKGGRLFMVGGGITEFIPTSSTLKINLFTSGIAYKPGDKLMLNLLISNYGPDETGDLYFGMIAPDEAIYSLPGWSYGLNPIAENFTFPESFTMPIFEVVDVTLPSEKPPISQPGKYSFVVALADSGTTYFRAKALTTIEMVE